MIIEKIKWQVRFYYGKVAEKFIIPSYAEKRRINLGYKNEFGLKIFVETGTFLGDTIEQFKNDFDSLISFELSKELADKALKRFDAEKNVQIVYGDSGELLPIYLQKINQPCLFWLDGHYSSEFFIGNEYIVTARGEQNTPIVKELTAIFSHPVKQHVILIDDARCFNGTEDYPTVAQIKDLAYSFRKDLSIVVKRDIIRIIPK